MTANLRPVPASKKTLPPHNLEAEEAVLGACMWSVDAAVEAIQILDARDFYKPGHDAVFRVIADMVAKAQRPDVLTVGEALNRKGLLEQLGGRDRLFGMVHSCPYPSSGARYARIVLDHSRLRQLIDACQQAQDMAFSLPDDVDDALDQAEARIYSATRGTERYELTSMRDLATQAMAEWDHGEQEMVGVSTGLRDLDELLGGLKRRSLTIIGARPSQGKTSLACGMARAVASSGAAVFFGSLEMSRMELFYRLLGMESGVPSNRLIRWKVTAQETPAVSHAMGLLADAPLHIDDKPDMTVLDVRARARRLSAKSGGLGLVVVDYLQLMQPPGRQRSDNPVEDLSAISRGLKVLASELDVPVIALSQLSRNLEYRGDKRPMLADLRGSGGIEQDADVVMFIYRDEVYDSDTQDKGIAEIHVAKNRNGPIGMRKVQFTESLTRFANLAYGSRP